MELVQIAETPHRRLNALTGDWVLVSPHRTRRPWQGQAESVPPDRLPSYDPGCYLCPGNERSGGQKNPEYRGTFVFQNDFAAVFSGGAVQREDERLFRSETVAGECRVICFSPRHDLTLPEMSVPEMLGVVQLWVEQQRELGERYRWVQIFENKGAAMGCSNPHPHGQIWATDSLPNEPAKEDAQQRAYERDCGRPLLLDYVEAELERGERVVACNDRWAVVVPYWATWPFETLLLPRRHIGRMSELDASERELLADMLKGLLTRYDNLFAVPFPYSMGWHGAPSGESASHWQLHAHFYPPLLRSATVKKFMVGYEMLAEAQRDLTPEQAAARLREQSLIHYKASR